MRVNMKKEKIYEEIDSTLDQLLKNARALEEISSDPLFVSALQKTQESLLSHLVHLNNYMKEKKAPKKSKKPRRLKKTRVKV